MGGVIGWFLSLGRAAVATGCGKVDPEPGSGLPRHRVDQTDPPPVQIGHPSRDREPEPGAAAGRVLQRAEPLEDTLAVLRRDPGPVVGHLEPNRVPGPPGPDAHHPALGAVPHGVVQQVGQQLVQPRAVRVDDETWRLDAYVEGHRAHPGLCLGDRVTDQGSDRHRAAVQRDHARVDAREVEEVADQAAQSLGLVECHPDRRGVRLGHSVVEVLEHGDQRGQRRTQLVRDARHEVAALAVHGGEVGGHPVERPGQLAHLVGGGRLDAYVVVARGHPSCRLRHLAQGRGHPDGEQLRDAEREEHGDRDAERGGYGAGAQRGQHRCHQDAGGDEQAELDLDGGDPPQRLDRPGPEWLPGWHLLAHRSSSA